MVIMPTALIVILIIAIIMLCSSLRVVKQANAFVIERLGTYKETWSVGLHLMIPVIDKVARRVSLKEQVADFPPQPVITKDNVTMRIDTVLFFQITDPKLYCYGV
ncbi:MAG TPA: peptidase, partial [Lachnospiraceae bacterium]|nr:peptidase [Lachnospiraceae bacterium]